MNNVYEIMEHGALSVADLRVGYGDTRYEYVDEQGVTRQGYVAWMDIVLESEGPSSLQHVQLHKAQQITYRGYTIKVLDIWKCDSPFVIINPRYCIRLLINPDGTQGMPATPESSQTPQP